MDIYIYNFKITTTLTSTKACSIQIGMPRQKTAQNLLNLKCAFLKYSVSNRLNNIPSLEVLHNNFTVLPALFSTVRHMTLLICGFL